MKTTSFVTLALLVACAAQFIQAEPGDCTARQGPGCVQCENVTITAPDGHQHHEGGHWDSHNESYTDSHSSHSRGGWRGGRRLKHGGRDGWGPSPDSERSRVVCVACDTGYVLTTRPNSTYGSCRCAPGWGSQPVTHDSSSTDTPWWEHRRGSFKCVDCSAKGQVPLTDKANLKLSWDGSSWVLVLADSASSSSVAAQHLGGGGRGWYQGWGAMGVPPPIRAGDCVSCPTGSKPSADYTSCVAGDKTFMGPDTPPSPSPADAPPTPASPAPPSTEYGACLTVSADDIDLLQTTISEACSADPTDSVPLDTVGILSDDPNVASVWFATDPQVMTEAGPAPSDLSMAECNLMAGLAADSSVKVTWLVNDTAITCSPVTGTFTFTIPAGLSQSSSQQVAGLVEVVPLNQLPVPALTGPNGASPSFRRVARKEQQPASQAPTGPAVVVGQPIVTATAVAAAPVPIAATAIAAAAAVAAAPAPTAAAVIAAAPVETIASSQVVAQSAIAEYHKPVTLYIAP